LSAALAQLDLHYAVRITALMLCRRGDQRAAIAALRQERSGARASLRSRMLEEKRDAIRRAARQAGRGDTQPAVASVIEQVAPARPVANRPRLVRCLSLRHFHHSR